MGRREKSRSQHQDLYFWPWETLHFIFPYSVKELNERMGHNWWQYLVEETRRHGGNLQHRVRTSLRLTEGGWGQYEVWVRGPKKAEVWARIREGLEQMRHDAGAQPLDLPAPRVDASGWNAPTARADERGRLHLKSRSPSRRQSPG